MNAKSSKCSSTSKMRSKQYTYAQVAALCSDKQTIIAIHDKVYNVTGFLNEHPGGEEILLDHGGKDASENFNDVGHSSDAIELMKKYQVGEIVKVEKRNILRKEGWKAGYNKRDPESETYVAGPGMPFSVLVGAVIAVLLAVYYLAF